MNYDEARQAADDEYALYRDVVLPDHASKLAREASALLPDGIELIWDESEV